MVFLGFKITGLDNIWDVKPLVSGSEIMQIAELSGGSSIIREWVS